MLLPQIHCAALAVFQKISVRSVLLLQQDAGDGHCRSIPQARRRAFEQAGGRGDGHFQAVGADNLIVAPQGEVVGEALHGVAEL